MPELNFFDNYVLQAITEEIVPQASFFRDRYFPTEEGDIFAADKVLTEYQKGDRKMACFVAPRVGDIPVERRGYAIHEYQPAYIAPSRLLTIDDLGTEVTSSFAASQLFHVLNERIAKNRSTIISTNMTPEEFSAVYSQRIYSRLLSHYKFIKLVGTDIRIQKKLRGGIT